METRRYESGLQIYIEVKLFGAFRIFFFIVSSSSSNISAKVCGFPNIKVLVQSYLLLLLGNILRF